MAESSGSKTVVYVALASNLLVVTQFIKSQTASTYNEAVQRLAAGRTQ